MPQQLHKSPENLDEVKVTLDFVTRMIIYDSYLLGNTANGIQVKEKLQNRWSVSHTDEKKEFQIWILYTDKFGLDPDLTHC